LEIGIRALADRVWQEEMRDRLARDAARLDAVLHSADVPLAGGTSLYRFVQMPNAGRLFALLGEAGILVRNFSWSAAALRFGLPADEIAWGRLEDVLALWENVRRAKVEEPAS
jgi:cobalamin biosynthetic protein CobC